MITGGDSMKLNKIKGARLNPKAAADFNEKMANNINTLETKVNKIIDVLKKKNLVS